MPFLLCNRYSAPENKLITEEILAACANEKHPTALVRSKSLAIMRGPYIIFFYRYIPRGNQEVLYNTKAALRTCERPQTS